MADRAYVREGRLRAGPPLGAEAPSAITPRARISICPSSSQDPSMGLQVQPWDSIYAAPRAPSFGAATRSRYSLIARRIT